MPSRATSAQRVCRMPAVERDTLSHQVISLDGEFDVDSALVTDADYSNVRGYGSVVDSVLERVNLSTTQFGPISLTNTLITGADLANASWQGLTARQTALTSCRAIGLRLSVDHGSDLCLTDCVLDYASVHLERVKGIALFKSCSFREATISGTLANVVFQDCDFTGAEFMLVNATGCDLRTSQLSGTRGISRLSGAMISADQVLAVAGQLAAESGLRIVD